MPLVDVGAMNASLANDYGDTRGPQAADSHTLELWYGDPRLEGSVELSAVGGYVAATVLPGDWEAPTGGAIRTVVNFADSTDEWSDPATHWALRGDDGYLWDADALTDPLIVTGPGTITPVLVVIYHADLQADPDE